MTTIISLASHLILPLAAVGLALVLTLGQAMASGIQVPHTKFVQTPAVAAVKATFVTTGAVKDAPKHTSGFTPPACASAEADAPILRPGGFCDYAMNPASLSDRSTGLAMTDPGNPGSPAVCAAKYISFHDGLHTHNVAC